MGGEIGVESTPGEGSTFWFTIQCKLGRPVSETQASLDVSIMNKVGKLRILVAEDNHVNQMLVTTLLGKAGHRVEVVGNGLEAVRAVQAAPYDMVLMDVQMPEMDGPTATKAIRRLESDVRDIPIIALTANAMAGHREEYLAAGMDDYVSKPIEPTALFQAIARVCGYCGPEPVESEMVDATPGGEGHAEPDPAADDALQSLLEDLENRTPSGCSNDLTPESAELAKIVPLFDTEAQDQLRVAMGAEAFGKMLGTVTGESEKLLHDIQRALGVNDLPAARRSAHTLMGMASNCAATRIAAVARELEVEVQTLAAAHEKTVTLKLAIEETRQWLERSVS
jgi:CheY-like chemotaxis protein/HPt (histidine-containing phosphotransfer) domain-containing protein